MRFYVHYEEADWTYICRWEEKDGNFLALKEKVIAEFTQRRGPNLLTVANTTFTNQRKKAFADAALVTSHVSEKDDIFFNSSVPVQNQPVPATPAVTPTVIPLPVSAVKKPAPDPTRSNILKDEGNAFFSQKNYQQAVEKYSEAIQCQETSVLYSNRAQAYFALGNFQAASDDSDKSIQLDPTNAKAFYKKITALEKLGRRDEILKYLDAAMALKNTPKVQQEYVQMKAALSRKKESNQVLVQIHTLAESAVQSKNYRVRYSCLDGFTVHQNAVAFYEQILQIDQSDQQALLSLGQLWRKAQKSDKAIPYLEAGMSMFPTEKLFAFELGKCLMDLKRFQEASQVFLKARELINGDPIEERLVNVLIAEGLYAAGLQQNAITILQAVIREDENHKEALFAYGKALMDHAETQDTIPVFLKLLVTDTENAELREIISTLVRRPDGLEKLEQQLSSLPPSAQVLGFLAMVVKDYGGISESIHLYSQALKLDTSVATYCLNLIHVIELQNDYDRAFNVIKQYCYQNPTQSVGSLTCARIYNIIRGYTTITATPDPFRVLVDCWSPKRANVMTYYYGLMYLLAVPALTETNPPDLPIDKIYDTNPLDLLAVFCTLTKIIYLRGNFTLLLPVIGAINPVREGRPLHTTTIRNEVAYHCCISQLLEYHKQQPPQEPYIYVSGDSHALVPAYHQIQYQGVTHTIKPLLVTGLKCWHLRQSSNFFPKFNFWNVAPTGSHVIFQFGEIDCREGLVLAVQKMIYKDIEEGALVAINIYIDVLLEVKRTCEYKIYVHPAVPVIDVTRDIVKTFNAVLKKRVLETEGLIFLDIQNEFLSPDGKNLKELYHLDGTHMNPLYLPVLEQELKRLNP